MDSKLPLIAIVGGSGFLGRALRAGIEACGQGRPISLSRPSFNLLTPGTWGVLPENVDCVVMAAGEMDAAADVLMAVNATQTGEFAAYARSRGAKRFILLSSGAVYGTGAAPTFPGMQEVPDGDYARSKLAGERLVAESWLAAPLAIIRLYFPYGRGQECRRLIPGLIRRLRDRVPIVCRPDGGPILSLTHGDDIVEVLLQDFIFSYQAGVFNLASPNAFRIEHLASLLATAIGVQPVLHRVGTAGDCISHPYGKSSWRDFDPIELI